MRKALMLSAILLLPACATNQPILTTPPARCASIVPDGWSQGVEAAPIPQNEPMITEWLGKPLTLAMAAAIFAPWAAGYVAMSGQLEKANGRTADTVEIVTDCEALVNSARADAQD